MVKETPVSIEIKKEAVDKFGVLNYTLFFEKNSKRFSVTS